MFSCIVNWLKQAGDSRVAQASQGSFSIRQNRFSQLSVTSKIVVVREGPRSGGLGDGWVRARWSLRRSIKWKEEEWERGGKEPKVVQEILEWPCEKFTWIVNLSYEQHNVTCHFYINFFFVSDQIFLSTMTKKLYIYFLRPFLNLILHVRTKIYLTTI